VEGGGDRRGRAGRRKGGRKNESDVGGRDTSNMGPHNHNHTPQPHTTTTHHNHNHYHYHNHNHTTQPHTTTTTTTTTTATATATNQRKTTGATSAPATATNPPTNTDATSAPALHRPTHLGHAILPPWGEQVDPATEQAVKLQQVNNLRVRGGRGEGRGGGGLSRSGALKATHRHKPCLGKYSPRSPRQGPPSRIPPPTKAHARS
jgi:hypothetical protein